MNVVQLPIHQTCNQFEAMYAHTHTHTHTRTALETVVSLTKWYSKYDSAEGPGECSPREGLGAGSAVPGELHKRKSGGGAS